MNIRQLKHQYGSIIFSKTMGSLSLLLSANMLNAVIGFVTSVLVLRYVENEVIAIIYPLVSILMIVGQFGDLGISNSFIKLASTYWKVERLESYKVFNAAFKLKNAMALLILIVTLPAAGYISRWIFDEEKYVDWTRIMIIISAIHTLSNYAVAALQVEGKFKLLSMVKVLPNLLKMGLIGIVIYLGIDNLPWIFWSFALVPLLTFVLAFMATDKTPLTKVKAQNGHLFDLFHVSKWIAISVVANAIIGQADILMTRSLGGADELARLAGAQRLASVIGILTMSLVSVLLPKVASMNTKEELNFFYRKSLLFVIPLSLLILFFIPISKFVIPIILGTKYISSIDVFNVYMIGNAIGIVVTPVSLVLYKLNKENIFALLNVLQMIACVCGNYLLIPQIGALGAAVMFAVSNLIGLLLVYQQLWKEGILSKQRVSI